jgi:hypothetical protein
MPNLESFAITFTSPHRTPSHPTFDEDDLPLLPTATNLRSLLLTLSADRALFPPLGIERLAERVKFGALTRLSILNMFCEASTLSMILALCTDIEELYLTLTGSHVIYDAEPMGRCGGEKLRILHLNAPDRAAFTMEDLTMLARELPLLEEIGSVNRVYEVHRRYEEDELLVELARWSRTFAPGYFSQNWKV